MGAPGTAQWLPEMIAQVKAILEGVAGVGKVHDYERWTDDSEKFGELFFDGNGLVNAWTISWANAPASDVRVHSTIRNHQIVLRGYVAVDDEKKTELAFRDIVVAICAAFQTNRKLNNTAHFSGPLSAGPIQFRRLSGVLVHYVECSLPVQEYPIDF